MGVPAFYKWLSKRYPNVIINCVDDGFEEACRDDEDGGSGAGGDTGIDLFAANPNGVEFDNLYLDMNGIIHPCVHPEDGPAPKTLGEMFNAITTYIDRLMHAVRPRRTLYMAIDGVAPRAKMNQQRSRRFRTAKDMADAEAVEEEQRLEMTKRGYHIPPKKKSTFDHNVITPGTEFMDLLAKHLLHFIRMKCSTDPYWRSLKIVLSDASAPGEGEHKIMEFIRLQRAQPGYNPNVRHVLHGLDADLIFLGLATHEAHFTILREEQAMNTNKCFRCGQTGHQTNECTGRAMIKQGAHGEQDSAGPKPKKFKPLQMVRLEILREYFAVEYEDVRTSLPESFEFDLERVLDDFTFMCFFVGNDFLPHLPSLDIREGAVDLLITMYKRLLPSLGGYLTHDGEIDFTRADVLLAEVGAVEDTIFRRRGGKEASDKRYRARMKAKASHIKKMKAQDRAGKRLSRDAVNAAAASIAPGAGVAGAGAVLPDGGAPMDSNKQAAAALRASLLGRSNTAPPAVPSGAGAGAGAGAASPAADSTGDGGTTTGDDDADSEEAVDSGVGVSAEDALFDLKVRVKVALNDAGVDENVEDHVRLGQSGWKDRYYVSKYGAEDGMDPAFRKQMFKAYAEGLAWVFRYYYTGVASWTWFYPYHYAPFASDLVNIDQYDIKFDLGKPFPPMAQLMGVLPSKSAHALPKAVQWLMTDPKSPIADFYPDEFKLDPNGKRLKWQWIALLPFIDEKRLLDALASVENTFTAEERRRNQLGRDTLVFSVHHPLMDVVRPLTEGAATSNGAGAGAGAGAGTDASSRTMVLRLSDGHPDDAKGIAGPVTLLPEPRVGSRVDPPPQSWLPALQSNQTVALRLDLPPYAPHRCTMLPGAEPVKREFSLPDRTPRPVRLNRRFNISDLADPNARNGNRKRGPMLGHHMSGVHRHGAFSGDSGSAYKRARHEQPGGYNQSGPIGHALLSAPPQRGAPRGAHGGARGGARYGGAPPSAPYGYGGRAPPSYGAPSSGRAPPSYGYANAPRSAAPYNPAPGARSYGGAAPAPRSYGGQQGGRGYSHGGSSGGYAHGGSSGGYAHGGSSGGYAHGGSSGGYAHGGSSGGYAHGATRGYAHGAGAAQPQAYDPRGYAPQQARGAPQAYDPRGYAPRQARGAPAPSAGAAPYQHGSYGQRGGYGSGR